MLEDAAASYRRALWHDQVGEVQIYVEKDAISGAIWPVTERWDVPLGVLRGYASESFAWTVAHSVCARRLGLPLPARRPRPGGVDAWRGFTALRRVAQPTVRRVDLEWLHFDAWRSQRDQIQRLELPTRPTKRSDLRAARFDGESVEVDAIPRVSGIDGTPSPSTSTGTRCGSPAIAEQSGAVTFPLRAATGTTMTADRDLAERARQLADRAPRGA